MEEVPEEQKGEIRSVESIKKKTISKRYVEESNLCNYNSNNYNINYNSNNIDEMATNGMLSVTREDILKDLNKSKDDNKYKFMMINKNIEPPKEPNIEDFKNVQGITMVAADKEN
jgi:hypothetical protein